LGSSIQPDERGLYPSTKEGKLEGDDFHVHSLPVTIGDKDREGGHNSQLHIRAKFTPYGSHSPLLVGREDLMMRRADALRQQFLRTYLRQYDIDDSDAYSYLEIFSMLDSLGSTLTKDTIISFFTRFGKADTDELTADEVVLCLEHELHKRPADKRQAEDLMESGAVTPSASSNGGAMGFKGLEPSGKMTAEPTDASGDMRTLRIGEEVVTNAEQGTTVKAPNVGQEKMPPPKPARSMSSATLLESSDSQGETVERGESPLLMRHC